MKYDVLIVGAGPAGIFTAYEMLKSGSKKKILMIEKGKAVENRVCPKSKTTVCVNCKPYCNITTGFSWYYCGKETVDGVELKKNDYINPKTDGITCGAPGVFQFVFEAKKAGKYELTFEYKRPWEKDVEPTMDKITVVVE